MEAKGKANNYGKNVHLVSYSNYENISKTLRQKQKKTLQNLKMTIPVSIFVM